MGEAKRKALVSQPEPIALDTFGGRIHVEWDPAAAVTPLGKLPFFIEFESNYGAVDGRSALTRHPQACVRQVHPRQH